MSSRAAEPTRAGIRSAPSPYAHSYAGESRTAWPGHAVLAIRRRLWSNDEDQLPGSERHTQMNFDNLLKRAASLVGPGPRAILGITGSPGAGKSTLARQVVRELNGDGPPWVAYVPMDGFHLADVELDRLGRRDRKGAPDTFDAAGYAALLDRLRTEDDETVYAPGFERLLEQPIAGAVPVLPAVRLVVTEGNYLLLDSGAWGRVRPRLDEVWFCEIDEEERIRRLVARHEEFGKDHGTAVEWVLGTDQRNADLVATTRDRADLIVPGTALPAPCAPSGGPEPLR
ncbi:Pantothenate kinase [Streptomyces sp. MBT84]|nr:Pantothenate kinase [Streptomyces sp. MBT84]